RLQGDWSSDVCSSDLAQPSSTGAPRKISWRSCGSRESSSFVRWKDRHRARLTTIFMEDIAPAISAPGGIGENKPRNQAVLDWVRSEERRVGKECRCRW